MLLLSCSEVSRKQNSNLEACTEVECKLYFLKCFLDGKPDSILVVIKIVRYLENVTGIESEASGSDIGKFNPTENDYINWKKWYNCNKGSLYWDESGNKVKILKK